MARSTVTKVCRPCCWRSEFRSSSLPGWLPSCSSSRGTQTLSVCASSQVSVYWYSAADCRPPMRRSCCACRNSRAPDTALSRGRRRSTTCEADRPRWDRGLSWMKTLAEFSARPPVKPATAWTAGSSCTICCSWASFFSMAGNEMLWSAMICPIRMPVSCSGKKVPGTWRSSATLPATSSTSTMPVSSAWSSTASSDRL